jgi:organic hydroperoxide reductase OsmC/OhrA
MQDLPHHYTVAATAESVGIVSLTSDGLDPISSAPPAEFGGPGDQWSPETLLVAAIADCFILAFRAIARASKLPWNALNCEVTGTLERSEGKTRFTGYLVRAALEIPEDANEDRANRILRKAEENCLVSNSLSGTRRLEAVVTKVP